MSREIKFRAFDYINKIFIYLTLEQGANFFPDSSIISGRNLSEWKQFTGLKDKKGKAIYEGDFFRVDLTGGQIYQGVVTFHEGRFDIDEGRLTCDFLAVTNLVGEVIGNIYENPELLQ